MNILYALGVAAITAIVALSGFNAHPVEQNVGATIPTAVALWESSLATAITSSATSMTLTSAVDKAGTTFASSTYAFVIDSGTSQEEMVIANCTATACTGMTRGISPITGTSTVASLQYAHRRGASVKITDGPQLLILSRILNGQETVPNALSYNSHPTFTSDTQLVDKKYADDTIAGLVGTATDSSFGTVKLSVAAASTTNPIAVGDNDTRVPTVDMSTVTAGQVAALEGTSGTGASSTNKYVDNNDTIGTGYVLRQSGALSYLSKNYTAGETIGMGNYVSIGDGTVATSSNGTISTQNSFTLSASKKIALSVAVPSTGMETVIRVKTTLYNSSGATSTPTIKASLRLDVAGAPGATELASTTASTGAVAPAGQATYVLIFPTPYTLTPSTTYWVVLSDTANLDVMQMQVTNGGGFPADTTSDEVTWTPTVNSLDFHWHYTTNTAGRAYNANATSANYRFKGAVGFASATTTMNSTVEVRNFGFLSGLLTGLTYGSDYYLSTTNGLISTATTTNSLKVGRAISTTDLITTNP